MVCKLINFGSVHILALLELELPYLKLGFDSFQEFLSSLDIKTLFPDENVLCIPRTVSELGKSALACLIKACVICLL